PHYVRFVGLIESLYEQRVVPSKENPLLELRKDVPLETLVKALKPDEVVVMTASGEQVPLDEKLASLKAERVVVILGGFPKGDFRSDLSKLNPVKVSLGSRMMRVWTVASKVLCAIEHPPKAVVAATSKPSKSRRAPKKKADA
ncbi:MAG TPA: hypothetical protein VGB78_05285, partial [Thermoplasmata archaeon]